MRGHYEDFAPGLFGYRCLCVILADRLEDLVGRRQRLVLPGKFGVGKHRRRRRNFACWLCCGMGCRSAGTFRVAGAYCS